MPRGSKVRLEWRGDDIQKRVRRATRQGLVETAAACVRLAVPRAPIQFGLLRRSIKIGDVNETRGRTSVQWGSFDIAYALYQEVGSRYITGKRFLLRSAEDEYPKIGQRIRDALR